MRFTAGKQYPKQTCQNRTVASLKQVEKPRKSWRLQQKPLKGDAGMVTAETAITTPVIILALTLLFAGGRVSVDYLQACEQARNAARQAAIETQANPSSSPNSNVSITVNGPQIQAKVTKQSKMIGQWKLPAVTCQATIWNENPAP